MSIAQNTALFSLLGTTYGGNGQTTFALPDLRGRSPIGHGQGPGLPPVDLGEIGGSPTHTLIITEMPAHNHVAIPGAVRMPCSSGAGDTDDPTDAMLAVSAKGDEQYLASGGTATGFLPGTVQGVTIGISGGSQPFNIRNPYLGMNYIIATAGIFPSRN